jgi:hypothetical protein
MDISGGAFDLLDLVFEWCSFDGPMSSIAVGI